MKRGLPERAGRRLQINPEILFNGKEDSYESNPGGVSFIFNHKFF